MYVTPTIQLWIQIAGGSYYNASDFLLDCGDIETIFSNYDTTLKIVETTATISNTILQNTSPVFTITSLKNALIKLIYDSKVIFVGFIKDLKNNPKTYEISLDLSSILDKLNIPISQAYFTNTIAPLLANFPDDQRWLESATWLWPDWITEFGWDKYEEWKGEGTLQNHPVTNPQQSTDGIVNIDKLTQAVIQQLTGYTCYLTNSPDPYNTPFGATSYEEGLMLSSIYNFNSEIVCSNESGRVQSESTWFNLINIFCRRGYTLVWNCELARFEFKKIIFKGVQVSDYRTYPLPETTATFETTTEIRNMRRRLKSTYEYCGWREAYFTTYTPIGDGEGSILPPPTKITNFETLTEYARPSGFPLPQVEDEVSFDDALNFVVFAKFVDDQYFKAIPLGVLCDGRFAKDYNINTVKTYPIYDNSDWDNQAFYNLIGNKIKNVDGVIFSELEILTEVV